MKRVLSIGLLAMLAVAFVRPRRDGAGPAALLGRALRGVRCGDMHIAAHDAVLAGLPRFELTSTAFADGAPMPAPYVDAGARQPPLTWSGLPAGTAELALIVEDADVPFPRPLVHAVAFGIDPARGGLAAGAIPRIGHDAEADPAIGLGRGAGGEHFLPPTPIPGHGPHRYVFAAFALREPLRFNTPPGKAQLVRELRRVAVAQATLTGTHEVR